MHGQIIAPRRPQVNSSVEHSIHVNVITVTAQQPAIATSCSAPHPDPSSPRREKAKSALTTAAQFRALSIPPAPAAHSTPQPTLQHTARAASTPFVPLSKKGLFENNQRAVFRPSTTSWTART
jgi:hypothetical protein